jgi:hypothetical protein
MVIISRHVYFKFYVELNDNLMTVYEEFPKCFKILKEVNKKIIGIHQKHLLKIQ